MWNTLILNPMVNILLWVYGLIGDFGIAIILFTIFIRLITQPLNMQQMRSMQAMQELQSSKEWLDMQKKFKDDKQKLQMAQAKLMQDKKINPFGSCLPMLIQLPVIFGLYQALGRAMAVTPTQLVDLTKRLYPFVNGASLIPIKSHFLWMDLSQPERVMVFGFGIPTLAILVVLTQYLQGKLMTPTTPSSQQDQTAQMSRMMNLYMPLFMGYIAYTLSSGLALYFLVTNIISIIQYAAMGKMNWRNLLPKKALPARTK